MGCILTHQLPFQVRIFWPYLILIALLLTDSHTVQTYLATYFVCVDFILVVQYYHYYKPPKALSSSFSHIRSATSPSAIRRMSIERGASRYRALSAAASHVAAAAALAAQQDEHGDRRSSTRYSSRYGRQHNASRTREQEEDEFEEEIPAGMMDSFRSERGPGEHSSKRVSWSVERHAGRAASVGRPVMSLPPTALHVISDEPVPFPRSGDAQLGSSTQQGSDHGESVSTIVSSRGSRASRKGSTMVFLGVWALFGIGTFANQRSAVSSSSTNIGHVLSSTNLYGSTSIPIALAGHSSFSPRDISTEGESTFGFISGSSHTVTDDDLQVDPHEPHEDPTSEQILGRIFAWLCTTLYLTSRLPQIWKNVSL